MYIIKKAENQSLVFLLSEDSKDQEMAHFKEDSTEQKKSK